MRMKHLGIAAALLVSASALAGCGTVGLKLGLTQQQDEVAYAAAATATDKLITSGKVTNTYAVAGICALDKTNYTSLTHGRNVGDGVSSYAPADDVHKSIQNDGAKYAPDFCNLDDNAPVQAPASSG